MDRSSRSRSRTSVPLRRVGIALDDLEQPVGTLSGGRRQCAAIARAVRFGARVLILDEPTAALGVKQSGVVLKYVAAATNRMAGAELATLKHEVSQVRGVDLDASPEDLGDAFPEGTP